MNIEQRIVKLVQDEYQRATHCLLHAVAKHAGMEASANAWDKASGASPNPYRDQLFYRQKDVENCQKAVDAWKEAVERVTNTFLETTWSDRYRIKELSMSTVEPTIAICCYDRVASEALYNYIFKNFLTGR